MPNDLTPNQIAEIEASNTRIKELGINPEAPKPKYRDGLDLLAEALGLIEPESEDNALLRISVDRKGKVSLGQWVK